MPRPLGGCVHMATPTYIRAFGKLHTYYEPISDEQLGAAVRRIARACSAGANEQTFRYYAHALVNFADCVDIASNGSLHVDRITVRVEPTGRIDGLIEHLLEMVTNKPVCVSGLTHCDSARCGFWRSDDADIPF